MRHIRLLLPFLASFFFVHHDRAQADCEPATCGNLTIRYPFWLGGSNRSSSSSSPCGHPAFEVRCSGDGSMASLKGSSIHVLRIDYANSSFVASHPRGPGYANAAIGCNCSAPIFAYLGGSYDWDSPPAIGKGRCTYTYLPVLGSEAEVMAAARNYSGLLKDGFVLEWEEAGIGNCAACKASGGRCRYDNAASAFVCLCPHGKPRGSTCAGEFPAA
ncbi:unnamed protein product [Urochloa decumbens]|uniref:Uncharacterized protein n=1 Tax=Urochloa decumbens TaxID=240449 RepID=A0ABC9AHV1_9POAL